MLPTAFVVAPYATSCDREAPRYHMRVEIRNRRRATENKSFSTLGEAMRIERRFTRADRDAYADIEFCTEFLTKPPAKEQQKKAIH